MQPKTILYFGSDEPLPRPTLLRAGPLTLVYENGDLRYIRFGEREILRRVYVAVRDHNWNTVPAALFNEQIEADHDAFSITFEVNNRQGPIDFSWKAAITGDQHGTITYQMEGIAHSTFLRNRIGFCVLHPIKECAGQPCAVELTDGQREQGSFPRYVAPHQPFKSMRALTHSVIPGIQAEVRFSGEVFEMEDQRNWTDASFKTYCTPLDLPFPVEVQRGTVIAQSVTLTLKGDAHTGTYSTPKQTPTLQVGAHSAPLPELGLGVSSTDDSLDPEALRLLADLNLAHLRVDLPLSDPTYRAKLQRAAQDARQLGLPLEIALFVTNAAEAELAELARTLTQTGIVVIRWLVFHTAEKSTDPKWVQLAQKYLAAVAPDALFGGGTNAYFAELNRDQRSVHGLALVNWSVNPQVHAFDNASLVETLEAQPLTALSARQFAPKQALSISPITLRPRFNPNATGADPVTPDEELPPQVDPRQMSLFAAGWTAISIKNLSLVGELQSLTYYETTGMRGVMMSGAGSPLPQKFQAGPNTVFPIYHVLAALGEFAGGEVIETTSNESLRFDGIALARGTRRRLLVSNFSMEGYEVLITGLSGTVHVKALDERTIVGDTGAMQAPARFRALEGDALETADGTFQFTLLPYAVAQLDWEVNR